MIEEESGGVFGEESKHYSLDGMQISRKQTTVEREVSARSDAAAGLASDLVSHEEMQKHKISAYMPHVSRTTALADTRNLHCIHEILPPSFLHSQL